MECTPVEDEFDVHQFEVEFTDRSHQRQVLEDSIMTNQTAILNEKCTSGSGFNQVGIMMVFLKEKFEMFIKNK